WWRDAAQSAVKSLVGPRAGLDLSGLRGRGGEDTAALGEGGGEVGQKKELTASTAPRKLGHDTEWVYVQIERLGELKEKGLLTEEEFTAKKAELLDRIREAGSPGGDLALTGDQSGPLRGGKGQGGRLSVLGVTHLHTVVPVT